MKKPLAFLLCFSLATFILPLHADSEEADPEKVIKYRQNIMEIIKNHNSSIKAIVKGDVPFKGHLNMHISALEKLFAEVGNLFPEGSDFGETSAKDAVWEQPDKFNQAVIDAQRALDSFKKTAAKGDMANTAAALKKFGKASCGGCHRGFRNKKD